MRTPPEHSPENCRPIGQLLATLGDKWTILILGALGCRTLRFKELHRAINGISQRMLTVRLRGLERDGILVRTVYPTIPPRVEYHISERGRSLQEALQPIGRWVMENRAAVEESRRTFDARCDADGPLAEP